MEKCCHTCGNIGITEVLLTCSKCKSTTEHLYCMRILLKEAPDDWSCEACESRLNPQKDLKLLNESRKGSLNWEKKVDTGKTKYISAEEAITLSSGAQKSLSLLKHNLDSGPSRQLKTQRLSNVDISEGQRKQSSENTAPTNERLMKGHPARDKSPQTNLESARKDPSCASAPSPNALSVPISARTNERMLKKHPSIGEPPQTQTKSVMKEPTCASASSPSGLPFTVSAPISKQVLKENPAKGKLPQSKVENMVKEPSSASARSPNPAPVIFSAPISKEVLKEHVAKGTLPQSKAESVMKGPSSASARSPNVPPVFFSGNSTPINKQVLKEHPAKGTLPQSNAESVMEPSFASARSPNAPPVIFSAPISKQMLKVHPAEGTLPQSKPESVMKEPSSASVLSSNVPPVICSGGNGLAPAERWACNAENFNVNLLPDTGKCSGDQFLDVLWNGSFCLQDDLINGELNLKALPPRQVSRKAYEFSKRMPKILHFELVPCKELEIHFFQEYSLDRRDIGLYFFSSHKERKYFSLMDYIGLKNYALRKQFDNVELLVFSSQLLPEDCQRLEGTYYLWGLFRRLKRDPTAHLDNTGLKLIVQPLDNANYGHNEGDNGEEVDMDIDMIGGVDVGEMDVVKRKPLQEEHIITGSVEQISVSRDTGSVTKVPSLNVKIEPDSDVPPGFEEVYRLRVSDMKKSSR